MELELSYPQFWLVNNNISSPCRYESPTTLTGKRSGTRTFISPPLSVLQPIRAERTCVRT